MMAKKAQSAGGTTNSPLDHDPGKPPIVEDPSLPLMEVPTSRPSVTPSADNVMAADPRPDTGGPGRMGPVSAALSTPSDDPGDGGARSSRVDQVALPDQHAAALSSQETQEESGGGYVRLRLRVQGANLSVVGVKEIEGPLIVANVVGSGLVYEVISRGRRIGLGSVQDANARRAFTNVDRPEAELGHGTTFLSSYEFDVRIPTAELTTESIRGIEIALHQLAQPPAQVLSNEPLPIQLADTITRVATLPGIQLEELEPPIQSALAAITLRQNAAA